MAVQILLFLAAAKSAYGWRQVCVHSAVRLPPRADKLPKDPAPDAWVKVSARLSARKLFGWGCWLDTAVAASRRRASPFSDLLRGGRACMWLFCWLCELLPCRPGCAPGHQPPPLSVEVDQKLPCRTSLRPL